MNLPNKLTISRIVLTFAFLVFLFVNGVIFKILALVTFLLASATDALDGFLAKKMNEITDFGKFMDPIADKILVLSSFIAFVGLGIIPAWMVVIIVMRELTITSLRIAGLGRGKVIAADYGGKQKMVSQILSIFAILVYIVFSEAGPARLSFWTYKVETVYSNCIFVLMLITVVLTIISGVSFLVKNRRLFSDEKTG